MSRERYFVPDLSPEAHAELRGAVIHHVFVAESPHLNEVAPEKREERRPLCGAAGRQWWAMLSEVLTGKADDDVSRERMLSLCRKHGIAVLNAVQVPLDIKITRSYPEADPLVTLGFDKGPGQNTYKKRKNSPEMKKALEALRARLLRPELRASSIYCLGNDAEWFVTQALGKEEFQRRVQGKIPHPSAWWRQNGLFGRIAREKLEKIL